jgi:hypothetical protein
MTVLNKIGWFDLTLLSRGDGNKKAGLRLEHIAKNI